MRNGSRYFDFTELLYKLAHAMILSGYRLRPARDGLDADGEKGRCGTKKHKAAVFASCPLTQAVNSVAANASAVGKREKPALSPFKKSELTPLY